jgi:hypothetical protein
MPDDAQPRNFRVAVDAVSDPGKPLAGVELKLHQRTVGTTDAKGRAVVTLLGLEGDTDELLVTCPTQYESPARPLPVTLRGFVQTSLVPTYTVTCLPTMRTFVAAIRAENGPNLPVLRFGRQVTTTDAYGIAHVLLEAKPGEAVVFTLATDAKEAERLRPQNPTLSFVAKGFDDFVVLQEKFSEEKPKPTVVAHVHRPSKL